LLLLLLLFAGDDGLAEDDGGFVADLLETSFAFVFP